MPAAGTINCNLLVGPDRLGGISNNSNSSDFGNVPLGTLLNTDTITIASESPSSYTTITYSGSKIARFYKCPGYDDNSDDYALLVNLPGYGATDRSGGSFANVDNSGEGLGFYLLSGDKPRRLLIVTPQNLTSGVDYGTAEWDAIVTYMTANYRIDTNRIYGSGLSGGAIALNGIFQNRTNCAAMISISGPQFGSGWATKSGVGMWFHQGTADGSFGETIGGSLYWANGGFSAWNDLKPAPRATYYYPKTHSSSVWSTEVFNRKERTDAAGTSQFDYPRWFLKHNLDAPTQATQFVENAEYTNEVVDYRESLTFVNALSSGSLKTSLLSRLAAVKVIVNRGGTRYIISFQNPSIGSLGSGYNLMTSFANGDTIANIVDEDGNPSTIGWQIINQFAASSRDSAASNNNAGRMRAKGFPMEFNLSGMVLSTSIINGSGKFTNIPSGKKVDVIVHHHHIATDDDTPSSLNTESKLTAIMNSVTKTQYSAYQNAYYMQFTDVPEVSGNAVLTAKCAGARNVLVQGVELLVHN